MPEGNNLKIGHTQAKKTFSNVGEIGAMLGYIHEECINVSVRDTRKVIYISEDTDQFTNMMMTYLQECGCSNEEITEIFESSLLVTGLPSDHASEEAFVSALGLLIEEMTVQKPMTIGEGTYEVKPVIYFDTLRFCFAVDNENDNSLLSQLTKLIKGLQCPTVTVHHTGKTSEGEQGLQRGRAGFEEGVIVHGAGGSSLVSNLEASFISSWDMDLNIPRVIANKKRQTRIYEVCIAGGRTVSQSALSRNGEWTKEDIWFPILKLYTLDEYRHLASNGAEIKSKSIYEKIAQKLINLSESVKEIEFKIGRGGKAEVSEISKQFDTASFTRFYGIAKQDYPQYRDWLFKVAEVELPKSGIAILPLTQFAANYKSPPESDF
ncbi:helicase RepA family protein [Polynucleobacter sp. JS-JIR-5-A7]|uniref:helicase RepA family protein n=1 Tax=Polynucleobacter sp. JS-JIR-5-A7 TaxID=1758395 RepID=UPI001BFD5CFE|nr:helicase RepA family protein [Polynucleobacter sp. JS-JIR-5-A7]QWE06058.1 hypothetical protein AOC29_08025 [Polynucleobacter sp. JS-JIR-5-A7]